MIGIVDNDRNDLPTQPDGSPVSVVDLRPGDDLLANFEEAGRHFSVQVDETIWER